MIVTLHFSSFFDSKFSLKFSNVLFSSYIKPGCTQTVRFPKWIRSKEGKRVWLPAEHSDSTMNINEALELSIKLIQKHLYHLGVYKRAETVSRIMTQADFRDTHNIYVEVS